MRAALSFFLRPFCFYIVFMLCLLTSIAGCCKKRTTQSDPTIQSSQAIQLYPATLVNPISKKPMINRKINPKITLKINETQNWSNSIAYIRVGSYIYEKNTWLLHQNNQKIISCMVSVQPYMVQPCAQSGERLYGSLYYTHNINSTDDQNKPATYK